MPGVRIPHRAQLAGNLDCQYCSHMKILGIETSCDETGVCIIEAEGGLENLNLRFLAMLSILR
jgi:hypothetical protein